MGNVGKSVYKLCGGYVQWNDISNTNSGHFCKKNMLHMVWKKYFKKLIAMMIWQFCHCDYDVWKWNFSHRRALFKRMHEFHTLWKSPYHQPRQQCYFRWSKYGQYGSRRSGTNHISRQIVLKQVQENEKKTTQIVCIDHEMYRKWNCIEPWTTRCIHRNV